MSYWLCSPKDGLILFSRLKTLPCLPISNCLSCRLRFCLTWLWVFMALSFFHFIRHVGFPLFFELAELLPASRPLYLLVSHLPWPLNGSVFLDNQLLRASLLALRVKYLPAIRKTWVQSLDQEDPLEKEMATLSSILAWKIPRMEEPGRLQSTGSQRANRVLAQCFLRGLLWPPLWEVYLSFSYLLSYQPLLNPHIARHMTPTFHWRYTVCPRAQLLSHVWLFVTPRTAACQASLAMEFPRQEYWAGFPFLPPEHLPDPGIKLASPVSPALAGEFFTTEPPVKPKYLCTFSFFCLLSVCPLDCNLHLCRCLSHILLLLFTAEPKEHKQCLALGRYPINISWIINYKWPKL